MGRTVDTISLSGSWHNGVHSFRTRIYYDATDAGGLVYHAEYLGIAEHARTESLRLLGFNQSALHQDQGIMLTVRSCSIEYRCPAVLDDLIEVETTYEKIRGARVFLSQKIFKLDEKSNCKSLLVDLQTNIACVNRHGRPTRFPEWVRESIIKNVNIN